MGGAVGTGLFLGSAQVIQSAGPSIILGYAIVGLVAFLIMRQMGEMIVEEPVVGSFSYFAQKILGKISRFFIGLELLGSVHFGCHDRAYRRS